MPTDASPTDDVGSYLDVTDITPPYRSPGVLRDYFSTPGNPPHVHIGASGDPEPVKRAVRAAERKGYSAEFYVVDRSGAGPQRRDPRFETTYRFHTPGTIDDERFDHFATIALSARQDIGAVVQVITPHLVESFDPVIEIEQTLAAVDDKDEWVTLERPEAPLTEAEIGCYIRRFARLEIHHAIYLLPIDSEMGDLVAVGLDAVSSDLDIGGWFRFRKPDGVAIQSTAFHAGFSAHRGGLATVTQKTHVRHRILAEYLSSAHVQCRVRTFVEEILGVIRLGRP